MPQQMIIITPDELREMIGQAVTVAIQTAQQPKAESRFLSVQELADFLKLKISTVYQLHSRRQLPGGRKLNGRLLFERSEVEAWAEERRILTVEQAVEAHHQKRKP